MDEATEQRAAHLRRIAAAEIEAHREAGGFLAAALDGSLATGAVWPSSDLDFTIVPRPGTLSEHWVEWGQRDGIPWHKHITYRRDLAELIDRYPESFVERAKGRFDADANWMLDGLTAMEIVEDSEGLLGDVKRFMTAHRFAPEAWEGRRAAFLEEIHRLLDSATAALEIGDSERAEGDARSLAVIAGQVWIESDRRIYSSKEQESVLAGVAARRGVPELADAYRGTLAVDEGRARSASPELAALAREAEGLWAEIGRIAPEGHSFWRDAPMWGAWARHFCERLSLASGRGNAAHVYQNLNGFLSTMDGRPGWIVRRMISAEMPGADALLPVHEGISRRAQAITDRLRGDPTAHERAVAVLLAGRRLVDLTERHV